MKNVLLIALVLTLSMGTAMAKQKGGFEPPARGGGDPIERLADQLGLDVDQVATITVIFEVTQALRDEEREAFEAILCEIRDDSHAQILAVLTPEQQVLFDEMQQKREELRMAIEEAHNERGFGGGRGTMNCDG